MLSAMTVEAQVKFTSLPSGNGSRMIIASKMGASGQYGWEFGIKKQGAGYQLYFLGALTGTTTPTEVKTARLSSSEATALTSGFNHVAAVWSAGSVRLFYNGTLKVSGTIGTAGSAALFNNSSTPFMVGTNATGVNYFDGAIDEVRLSQTARWSATFTAPAAAYTAD
jgi:hypothetical protein